MGKAECVIESDLISKDISDKCIDRVEDLKYTGGDFLMVAGCISDSLDFYGSYLHK